MLWIQNEARLPIDITAGVYEKLQMHAAEKSWETAAQLEAARISYQLSCWKWTEEDV